MSLLASADAAQVLRGRTTDEEMKQGRGGVWQVRALATPPKLNYSTAILKPSAACVQPSETGRPSGARPSQTITNQPHDEEIALSDSESAFGGASLSLEPSMDNQTDSEYQVPGMAL